jgi:hypothetical protein
MSEFLINDVALYVSKTLETAYNGDVTAGNKYAMIRTQQPAYVLPQVEFVDDAGVPGNGHEFATTWCPTYISHPAFAFTDDVNFGIAGRLALRALGGSVSTAQLNGTSAYKHSCSMLPNADGRQLPSFAMASLLGGASYRVAGVVVDRFRLSQNRADRPQYTVDVVGSGKYTDPLERIGTCTISNASPAVVTLTAHGRVAGEAIKFSTTGTLPAGITAGTTYYVLSSGLTDDEFQFSGSAGGAAVDTTSAGTGTHFLNFAALPSTMDIADCLNGAETVVQWTDSSGAAIFTGLTCTLRSWFIEVANNSRLEDRCPGDPTKTITYNGLTTTPAFVNRLRRGSREVTSQIVILLGSSVGPWERYVTGEQLTDVTFKAQGNLEAGTGYKYTINMIIPKARIRSIEPGEVDGEATLTINLLGMYDSTSNGACKVEVINQETGSYV